MPPANQENPDSSQPFDDPRDRELIELRARLAAAAEQLAHFRQTEENLNERLLLATARATEMEHHLHRRIIEVTDLKNRLAALEVPPEHQETRPNPMARRFSPLLARTTLRLHRSEN